MSSMKKKISIVVPMYNEEEMASLFFETLNKTLETITQYDFELIAVNDGSKDKTLDVLKSEQEKYPNIVIVDLSRNFGQESAITAGLRQASGDAAIPMDCDLQDPPEIIPELITEWEKGYQVVNACRVSRKKDGAFKKSSATFFYDLMDDLSPKVKVPQNVGNFRLIDRRVLDEVNALSEKVRAFRVQVPFVGFKVGTVFFTRVERAKGRTKYNVSSMINLALDSIVSLTSRPLRIPLYITIGFIGLFFTSVICELVLFILHLCNVIYMTGTQLWGWLIINVILFISCAIIGILAVMSLYLGNAVEETKNRPNVIVKEVIKK